MSLSSSHGWWKGRHVATVVDPSAPPLMCDRDAAFERYVRPEIWRIEAAAHRLTWRPTEAEDLLQETLLRAYRAMDRFDGRYPRAWLMTILRNTHINGLRRRRPEPVDDERLALHSPLWTSTSWFSPDEAVEVRLDAKLAAAWRLLPLPQRAVIALVDVDGHSYASAAAVLGIPVGTVMSRIHRGRHRLRGLIEQSRSAGGTFVQATARD